MRGSNKDLQKFKLVSWESHGGGCGHRFHKEKIQLKTSSQKATAKFTRRTMLALVPGKLKTLQQNLSSTTVRNRHQDSGLLFQI